MASYINTNRPSALGVPTLLENHGGSYTGTYPHLITQAGISFFQRAGIDVRIGPPEDGMMGEGGSYVQHPEPFDAHGELSVACRTLLLTSVQTEVMSSKFDMFECVVWSPTSCSYVAPDGAIFETCYGLASPARVAFETMRQLLDTPYPQINVATPYGITREACPVDVSKGDAVAQAVEIVLWTGWKARVVCSDSESIYAALTDEFGSVIQPCVIWSQNESGEAVPIDWDTLSGLKHPYIIAGGDNECALFCPDLTTLEELKAKAAEISALAYPRVRIVWSSTESFADTAEMDAEWRIALLRSQVLSLPDSGVELDCAEADWYYKAVGWMYDKGRGEVRDSNPTYPGFAYFKKALLRCILTDRDQILARPMYLGSTDLTVSVRRHEMPERPIYFRGDGRTDLGVLLDITRDDLFSAWIDLHM